MLRFTKNLSFYVKTLIKNWNRLMFFFKDSRALKKNGQFDSEYYKATIEKLDGTSVNAFFHFVFYGKYEMRPASSNYTMDTSSVIKYRYRLESSKRKVLRQINQISKKPFISVLIFVDKETSYNDLNRSIQAVKRQWYKFSELCIAFSEDADSSLMKKTVGQKDIRCVFKTFGFKAAYELSKGTHLALTRAGDVLTVDALAQIALGIDAKKPDLIYADDDDMVKKGVYENPFYKTDFSYEMLLSTNYIGYFSVISKKAMEKYDICFDDSLGKTAAYDLYLKISEHTDSIAHLQKILYHKQISGEGNRAENMSLQRNDENNKTAIINHLKRKRQRAEVTTGRISGSYRVLYKISGHPLVSIIIPFKDKIEVLETCIKSILRYTYYENFEIIAVSNNSHEDQTLEGIKKLRMIDKRIKFFEYNVPFNYSTINDYAVKTWAKGEYILFLNNDTKVIKENWLTGMLSFAIQDWVGAVGPKLYYPNDVIQTAGIGLGMGGYICEYHKFFERNSNGYFGRLKINQNVRALSAACLMVAKRKYLEVGGFDEKAFAINYNDLDLCFKLIQKGYKNVFTPFVELYHYESLSRLKKPSQAAIDERNALIKRYSDWAELPDPYYSMRFDPRLANFSLLRRKNRDIP